MSDPNIAVISGLSSDALATYFASKLASVCEAAEKDIVFIARSDVLAERASSALRALLPSLLVIHLPAWDCLPHDRVPPSREAMGRRMDALRDWINPRRPRGVLVTSLDVLLQRIPPMAVITHTMHQLTVGTSLAIEAFQQFIERTGYILDGVVDEPGEVAMLQDVIDIFPAGATRPMRIYRNEQGKITDLRFYDPVTQRTETSLETMVFGPATELIRRGDEPIEASDMTARMERQFLNRYDELDDVFAVIGTVPVYLDPDVDQRVDNYLDIIEDARQAQSIDVVSEINRGLYLTREEWNVARQGLRSEFFTLDAVSDLPTFFGKSGAARAFSAFVKTHLEAGDTVVIAGSAERVERLTRRLSEKPAPLSRWQDCRIMSAGSVVIAPFELKRGFIDHNSHMVVVTSYDVMGPVPNRDHVSLITLEEPELKIGDVTVHEDYGIGVLTALETTLVDGVALDAVRLSYHGDTSMIVPIAEFGKLWRYGGAPDAITLDRLHTDGWFKKRDLVAHDIRSAAQHLMEVASSRGKAKASVIEPPKTKYRSFVSRFPFTLTIDQEAAIDACLSDMTSGVPMNRLICGDVGYGKTEVALRAAAAAALSGKQVVILAPTTVLARQHFLTFQRRFAGLDIAIEMMSRVLSAGKLKDVKKGLAKGSVDLVVATQAVLSKDVVFHDLGLLVIDEEHRFGAADKERMRALAPALHVLTMSATPIPRSLQAAMVGVQEVSLLTTPPARRRPVRTSLVEFDRPSVATALRREHRRGGQSFFVVPRIEDISELKDELQALVPELSLLVAHGKMPASEMDDTVVGFAEGESDILLSTNIIENGLDIPRANTIFIWRADRFGLAQLHQLRGRVGRGRAQGNAYLLTVPGEVLADETRLRLETMVKLDRLGSGLSIAMCDLDLRGAGDLSGEAQAGHVKKIGTGLYQKMLVEALRQLRAERKFAGHAEMDLGFFGYIPADYVPDAMVRLSLYTRLLRMTDRVAVDDLEDEMSDRFGEPVEPVQDLLRISRLKLTAAALGISKLSAGPLALALTFADRSIQDVAVSCKAMAEAEWKGDRAILKAEIKTNEARLAFFEALLAELTADILVA